MTKYDYHFAELKALMKYITGAPTVHGNTIVVSFEGASATPAGVTVSTCGREIRLSRDHY